MIVRNKIALASLFATAVMVHGGVEPLPRVLDSLAAERRSVSQNDPNEVHSFFKENFAAGGYQYVYPEESSKVLIPEGSGKTGEVALQFDLDAGDYSGGAVVLHGTKYDLSSHFGTGALEFWVKGKNGGEKCKVALADDELEHGVKTEIGVDIANYGGIQPYWTYISIPLADFGRRGEYWDEKAKHTVRNPFHWNSVKEFLITIAAGDQDEFNIFVDDVIIARDRYTEPADLYAPYWDEVKETIPNHPAQPESPVVVSQDIFVGDFVEGMYCAPYGGKTTFSMQATDQPQTNAEVMAFYLDNGNYSGNTMRLPQSFDVSNARETGGGIAFWGRAPKGVDKLFVGLNDDGVGSPSVGTSVLLSDYGYFDGEWHYFMIPLKEFPNEGGWWDETTKTEKPGEVNWSSINGITLTTEKYGNRIAPGDPVPFYFDDVVVIESVPGYVDPDIYWDDFHSDAADKLIFDFEDGKANAWESVAGEKSDIAVTSGAQTDRDLRDRYGLKYLQVNYSLNDWAYFGYPFARYSSGPEYTDWSEHRAVTMDIHTGRDEEKVKVRVQDAGGENWYASVNIVKGWNEVVVPFRNFRKDPYDQTSSALLDGKLDMSNVKAFSVAPATIGIASELHIDNVTLTNNSDD